MMKRAFCEVARRWLGLVLLTVAPAAAHGQFLVFDAANVAQVASVVTQLERQYNTVQNHLQVARDVRSKVTGQLAVLESELRFYEYTLERFGLKPPVSLAGAVGSIEREVLEVAGSVPLSTSEAIYLLGGFEYVASYYDWRYNVQLAQEARKRLRESYRGVLQAMEGHQNQMNESGRALAELEGYLERAETPQQQREVQSNALITTATETVLLRDVMTRQTYLMGLRQMQEEMRADENRAALNYYFGQQAPPPTGETGAMQNRGNW